MIQSGQDHKKEDKNELGKNKLSNKDYHKPNNKSKG